MCGAESINGYFLLLWNQAKPPMETISRTRTGQLYKKQMKYYLVLAGEISDWMNRVVGIGPIQMFRSPKKAGLWSHCATSEMDTLKPRQAEACIILENSRTKLRNWHKRPTFKTNKHKIRQPTSQGFIVVKWDCSF